MARKTNPAPQTEVLSVTQRPLSSDDPTPSNEELPSGTNPEPDSGGLVQQPPVSTESLDQPQFTIDESQEQQVEPEQPEGEQVTHDPLKDTQAELTRAKQELADNKKLLSSILLSREFSQPQTSPQPPAGNQPDLTTNQYLPEEMPGADPNYPLKYMQRQNAIRDYSNQQRADQSEIVQFARDNPDFPEYIEDMRLISARRPGYFQGPRAIPVLYELAKKERQINEFQNKQAEQRDRAMAAGAQMVKNQRQPFASPRAGGGSVPASSKMPAGFANWSTAKQKEWLKQRNLYVEET